MLDYPCGHPLIPFGMQGEFQQEGLLFRFAFVMTLHKKILRDLFVLIHTPWTLPR